MSSQTLSPSPNQRQGRLMLALIVGLLALPFVIGAGLYFGGWQPPRISHHGHLLTPPRLLPEPLLRSTGKNGEKWIFLLNVRGPCTDECTDRLDQMRRIQVSLNKDMGRLRRVVLTDQPADPNLATLSRAQPDLLVVVAEEDGLGMSADPLFLADPQGRLIMSYPPDAAAKGVRADLERLLKFAWTS
jgi:hypothetical protein